MIFRKVTAIFRPDRLEAVENRLRKAMRSPDKSRFIITRDDLGLLLVAMRGEGDSRTGPTLPGDAIVTHALSNPVIPAIPRAADLATRMLISENP